MRLDKVTASANAPESDSRACDPLIGATGEPGQGLGQANLALGEEEEKSDYKINHHHQQ